MVYALVQRPDFIGKELRYKILFTDECDYFQYLRTKAALFVSFTDEEFYEHIKDQSEMLSLFSRSSNLSLAQYEFLQGAVDGIDAFTLANSQDLHLKKIPQNVLRVEVDDLVRILFIKRIMDDKDLLDRNFKQDIAAYSAINDCLKVNDLWESYMLFKKAHTRTAYDKLKSYNFSEYVCLCDDIEALLEHKEVETKERYLSDKLTEELKELKSDISIVERRHTSWLVIMFILLVVITVKLFF